VTIVPCSHLNLQPYPGFNPNELHEYVFVPLPSLRRRLIHRQLPKFEGEEQGVVTSDDDAEDDTRKDLKRLDAKACQTCGKANASKVKGRAKGLGKMSPS
jgi:hypothetical protein